MTTTVDDIINFVDERKYSTKLSTWTRDQVKHYIWQNINDATIRVAFDTDESILGVIMFNPNVRGNFVVNQFFGGGSKMWILFLGQLLKEFPDVKDIYGIRHGNRFVKFNLKTLIKLYGRRSKSTNG